MGDDRPAFMVIDASTLSWGNSETLGAPLTRAQVLADPVCNLVYEILDRVVFDDRRVREFLSRGGS
jgi:hypothetical protein